MTELAANMPTLGEELRRRREALGKTLTDISETTRIGTRFLKAIETDNYSVLHGGIYTRAFIRSYAKEVGMDEDEAIALYQRQVAAQAAEPPARQLADSGSLGKAMPTIFPDEKPPRKPPRTYTQTPTNINWSTVIIGAGIVLFVGVIIYALVKQFNQAAAENTNQPVVTQPQPPAPPPEQPAPGAETPAQPPAVSATDMLNVQLMATTGDSWIRFQVDDNKPEEKILKASETLDVPPAQNAVTIRYGIRDHLKLRINNRDANFPPDMPKFKGQFTISRDTLQSFFQ